MVLLLLLLFALGCVSEQHSRVVGGADAEPYQYPWMLAQITKTGNHVCGASLIAPRWVLTAAHCVDSNTPNLVDVHLHRHDVSKDPSEEEGIVAEIKRVFIHENYDDYATADVSWPDIALIELAEPVDVEPVKLATLAEYPEGAETYLIGWGATDQYCSYTSSILQEAYSPVVNKTLCDQHINNKYASYDEVSPAEFCAGVFEGSGPEDVRITAGCGDSGGPLVVFNEDGSATQLGIVSYAIGYGETAEDFYEVYTLYTRVGYFFPWIESTMANNPPTTQPPTTQPPTTQPPTTQPPTTTDPQTTTEINNEGLEDGPIDAGVVVAIILGTAVLLLGVGGLLYYRSKHSDQERLYT